MTLNRVSGREIGTLNRMNKLQSLKPLGEKPQLVLIQFACTTFSVIDKLVSTCGLPWWCRGRVCLPVQETEETQVRSLGQEDPMEKEMATRSSVLDSTYLSN